MNQRMTVDRQTAIDQFASIGSCFTHPIEHAAA